MVTQSRPDAFEHPIFFHQLTRLCEKQQKHQPTLLMSENTWKYVSDPGVTHEGAFGSDFCVIPMTKMKSRFINSSIDTKTVSKTRWVVVWKFPGDLNHLRTSSDSRAFVKILDVPLPVGDYPLYDDGWMETTTQSHPSFPKNKWVEKMRTDVPHGRSVHYLENKNGVKVAMLGSHYYIQDLWKVKKEEKTKVSEMLKRLRKELHIHCFPCYGQHHAIVFYVYKKKLITPRLLSEILQKTDLLQVLSEYGPYEDLTGWAENVIRLTPKPTFASTSALSPSPVKSALPTKQHRQPHPTGSLLRENPTLDSSFVSQYPVPNNVNVELLGQTGEFTRIRYGKLEGWVRSKYLS